MIDTEELAIMRRRPPEDGLFAQREAHPEVADVRPVATLHFPGPATHAKREAHAQSIRSLDGRRGKILAALAAYGPMTRLRLHEITGLSENSTNSAVHSLMTLQLVHHLHELDPETHRSVVALVAER